MEKICFGYCQNMVPCKDGLHTCVLNKNVLGGDDQAMPSMDKFSTIKSFKKETGAVSLYEIEIVGED